MMKTYDMSTGQLIKSEPLHGTVKASKATALSCPSFAVDILPGLISISAGELPATSRPIPPELATLDLDAFLGNQ